jgi:hypothetical protein
LTAAALCGTPSSYQTEAQSFSLLLRQFNMSGFVIPAEAGIQAGTGCRITSGMTALAYLDAGLIIVSK